MKLFSPLLLAMIFSFGSLLPTPATAQIINDRTKVISITGENLGTFLRDAAWPYEQTTANGQDILIITVDGKKLVLWPRACNDRGVCSGLMAFAVLPSQASTANVNAFNSRYHPIRAVMRDGQVVLDSYVVADFGVTRGSLLVEISLLASMVDAWWAFQTPSPQGPNQDMGQDLSQGLKIAYDPLLRTPPAEYSETTHIAGALPFDAESLQTFTNDPRSDH